MIDTMRPRLAVALLGVGLSAFAVARAEAQQVQITKLADFTFGLVSPTASDLTQSKNVCISSNDAGGRYNIRATGSGSGGAFALAGVGSPMPYEVQWSASPGQATGTALVAGVALSGLTTTGLGLNLNCVLGNDSASLIVVLRSAALGKATAGAYSGTLTLLIAAE